LLFSASRQSKGMTLKLTDAITQFADRPGRSGEQLENTTEHIDLGETWGRARRAAIALTSHENKAIGDLLITDIKQILVIRGVDRLRSKDLVSELAEMEYRPRLEWDNGRPTSARAPGRCWITAAAG
jgi:hypothetical protein